MSFVLVILGDTGDARLLSERTYESRKEALDSLRASMEEGGPSEDVFLVDMDVAAPVVVLDATPSVAEEGVGAGSEPMADAWEAPLDADVPREEGVLAVAPEIPVDEEPPPPPPVVADEVQPLPVEEAVGEETAPQEEAVAGEEAPQEGVVAEQGPAEEAITEEETAGEATVAAEEAAAEDSEGAPGPEPSADLAEALKDAADTLVAEGVVAPEFVPEVAEPASVLEREGETPPAAEAEPEPPTPAPVEAEQPDAASWPWELTDEEPGLDLAEQASAEDASAAEEAEEPDGSGGDSDTCDDCVYQETCPQAGEKSPATCGSFQWRAG